MVINVITVYLLTFPLLLLMQGTASDRPGEGKSSPESSTGDQGRDSLNTSHSEFSKKVKILS